GQHEACPSLGVDGVKTTVVGQAHAGSFSQAAKFRSGKWSAVGDQVDADLNIDAGAQAVHFHRIGECMRAQWEICRHGEKLVGYALHAFGEQAEALVVDRAATVDHLHRGAEPVISASAVGGQFMPQVVSVVEGEPAYRFGQLLQWLVLHAPQARG